MEEDLDRLSRGRSARSEAEPRIRRLEMVIEAVPDGVVIVDRQGKVVALNSAASAIGGTAVRRELLRPLTEYQKIYQFFELDGRPVKPQDWTLMRALRGERVILREVRFVRPDGRELVVQINAAPVLDERGDVVEAVAVVRDVTEQRRWERHREVLARVGQALSQKLDLDAVLQTVLDQTLQALGADAAIVLLDDAERKELRMAAYRNLLPASVRKFRRLSYNASFLSARAFRKGEMQVVEDISRVGPELAAARAVAEEEGERSLVGMPLRAAGRVIGSMAYASRTTRRFFREELETVARVADLFGMAIENATIIKLERDPHPAPLPAGRGDDAPASHRVETHGAPTGLAPPLTKLLFHCALIRDIVGAASCKPRASAHLYMVWAQSLIFL